MSKKLNDAGIGGATRLTLNTVAAALAFISGQASLSFWFKKEAGDTGNYSLSSLSPGTDNSASYWMEHVSGTTFRMRARANGVDGTQITVGNAGTSWTNVILRFDTDTSYVTSYSINGAAYTSNSAPFGSASNALTKLVFGAADINGGPFGYVPNAFFSYIGVWDRYISVAEKTQLQTLGPHLVAPGNLLWASDSELTQVAGTVTETIAVSGSDITASPNDNPELITSLGVNRHSSIGGGAVSTGLNASIGGGAVIAS